MCVYVRARACVCACMCVCVDLYNNLVHSVNFIQLMWQASTLLISNIKEKILMCSNSAFLQTSLLNFLLINTFSIKSSSLNGVDVYVIG